MVGWLLGFLTCFLLPNYLIVDREALHLYTYAYLLILQEMKEILISLSECKFLTENLVFFFGLAYDLRAAVVCFYT
jgi:hypothetical protein